MSLFRSEVLEQRSDRLHGEVVFTQPLSTKLFAGALFGIVAIAAVWVDASALAGLAGLAGVDWDAFWEMQSAANQEELERQEAAMQEQQDLDGDGLPGITVTEQRPLPDSIAELSLSQLIAFSYFALFSGDQQFADVQAGTNFSGENPNDILNADRRAEIEAQMLADAFEGLVDEMAGQIP